MIVGALVQLTKRCMAAILPSLSQHISWPSRDTKQITKDHIFSLYHIPHCLGFADGVHINLERAPAQKQVAGRYHSRKERYGFNLLAAVDHNKRFTFVHWGYSAASADQRLQRNCSLQLEPEAFFDLNEFILTDSGFTCTDNFIPMFRNPVRGKLKGREVRGIPALMMVARDVRVADASGVLQRSCCSSPRGCRARLRHP